ncbi:hypothetical protein ACUSIJ_23260 [Pseudochelatococcus sp. B33]
MMRIAHWHHKEVVCATRFEIKCIIISAADFGAFLARIEEHRTGALSGETGANKRQGKGCTGNAMSRRVGEALEQNALNPNCYFSLSLWFCIKFILKTVPIFGLMQ